MSSWPPVIADRSARALANLDALIEMARPYDVAGLAAFVRDLQLDWETRAAAPGGPDRRLGRCGRDRHNSQLKRLGVACRHPDQYVDDVSTSAAICPPPIRQHAALDHRRCHTARVGGRAKRRGERQESLQRERMWYVACTRARDLLIIPHLPIASSQSWSKILDLGQGALPQLNLDHLPMPAAIETAAPVNAQSPEQFAREAQAVAAAAPTLNWRRPSDYDSDRPEALEPLARTIDETFEYIEPVGAGRVRGVLLHKLMEEFLTGELPETDSAAVEQRATQLLNEVLGEGEARAAAAPDPKEVARTALNTLSFADVAKLRPHLVPEVAIWARLHEGTLLAGRADALAVVDSKIMAAVDWKSDIAPTSEDRLRHAGQLRDYLGATGAQHGMVVYMSLGEVITIVRN